jgi:Ca2+-binding EF-hand superfamily protein
MGNCAGGQPKKDPKQLTDEEVNLLLQNTRLTRPQILALHANFLKECPSGKLTKKDFVKLFKEVHPSENKKEKADKFCQYVFKVIDKQNQGYISFQDFVLCFALTSDGDLREKCEFAFKLYDLDKDGKISKKEMTQVLTALYDLSGIDARKGDQAPQKKVEDIIKKINLTYAPPPPPAETAAVEQPKSPAKDKKAAKPAKDKKPAKAAKPAKEAKLPEFITKEQFIDACSSDEQLKKLFVDSIFANHGKTTDEMINDDGAPITITTSTSITSQPADTRKTINIQGPSLSLEKGFKAPSVSINSTKLDRAVDEEPIVKDGGEAAAAATVVPPNSADLNADLQKLVDSVNSASDGIHVTVTETETKTETKTVSVNNGEPVVEETTTTTVTSTSNHADSSVAADAILNSVVAPAAAVDQAEDEKNKDENKQ